MRSLKNGARSMSIGANAMLLFVNIAGTNVVRGKQQGIAG